MKPILFFLFFAFVSLNSIAQISFPVAKPDLGAPTLVVCHQNAYNYFVVDLTSDRCNYKDLAGLQEKTGKMVTSFRFMDADIYALCEVEVNDSALSYLTHAMNDSAGSTRYAYVHSGLTGDNSSIMSGFIYRLDRVRPIGSSIAASSRTWYENTMRLQTWEEIATGERFILSENHFKAKDSSEDQGQAKRNASALELLESLRLHVSDSDILIIGDLNETTYEPAVSMLIDSGYAEQIERFNTGPYSYCYDDEQQLIDHALASATMASQITGAGVVHINTATASAIQEHYQYSDHDPILIGLRLSDSISQAPCAGVHKQQNFGSSLGGFTSVIKNGSAKWSSKSTYGATISAYYQNGKDFDAWLISPEYDLSGMTKATITLSHNILYNNAGSTSYRQYQTLWCTTNYTGDPASTEWTQIPISSYAVQTFVQATCSIADSLLGARFRYAFHYTASAPKTSNYWAIKMSRLDAQCATTDVESVGSAVAPMPKKFVRDGQLYILYKGTIYSVLGLPVRQ